MKAPKEKENPPRLDAALAYQARGWSVIPIKPSAKEPLVSWTHWQTHRAGATQIKHWWKLHPLAGVGVILGQVSGMIGLDLDGPDSDALLQSLFPDLPPTLEFKTPGGGRRLLYAIPEGAIIKKDRWEDGKGNRVELLAEGALTVMPPSIHKNGNQYGALTGELVEAPPELLARAGKPAPEPGKDDHPKTTSGSAANGQGPKIGRNHLWNRGVAFLETCIANGPARQGDYGRETLWKAALGLLKRVPLQEQEWRQLLEQVYNPACLPPWKLEEATDRADFNANLAGALKEWQKQGCPVENDDKPSKKAAQGSPKVKSESPPVWEAPTPLTSKEAKPDPFPLEVLTPAVWSLVEKGAAAIHCPHDFLAVPALATAGAAIGANWTLRIKDGWEECGNLYAVVVGRLGSAKTPALNLVTSPVYEHAKTLHQAFEDEWKKYKADKENLPRPREKTLSVSDVTTEKLAEVLQENARGVVLIRDELTAWALAMNQYRQGKGADRDFYNSAWSRKAIQIHRKNQPDASIFIPHPFLAVVGGVQPDRLAMLRGPAVDDGWLDRILFSWPAEGEVVGEDWAAVDEAARKGWQAALEKLWKLSKQSLQLAEEAKTVWKDFRDAEAADIDTEKVPDFLRGSWAKFAAYCARFAVIFHSLRYIDGEDVKQTVDGETMKRAVKLVRYFQSHARKVYAAIDADPSTGPAKIVLRWIKSKNHTTFTFRDCQRGPGQRFQNAAELRPALSLLVRHGFIRQCPEEEKKERGRPPTIYQVNPKELATD